ncbi:hypothetical protein COCMIDRAFT_32186 [Bipolaris oryzae ATCC 44560]|uniref:Uncharacterized protein n=1 Tax=Bipolaris oryzae ATCC 44560 TaxID=930090 RepID=W6ZT36_COCMI|nr:uncharacterized protein COCMIDRAFT_32186 [Bipolaris oryzae ATCC 44560]EUC50674.1 hypothetical protein COCMIDRAFT_32186 [Bipolaris oryzae ATCC 44560]
MLNENRNVTKTYCATFECFRSHKNFNWSSYSFLQCYVVTLASKEMVAPVAAVSGLVMVVVSLARIHVLEPRVEGYLPNADPPDGTDPAIKTAWLVSELSRITSSPQASDKRYIWRGSGLAKDIAPGYTFVSESRSNEVGPKLIRVSCNVGSHPRHG